jgi:hypothetical protein
MAQFRTHLFLEKSVSFGKRRGLGREGGIGDYTDKSGFSERTTCPALVQMSSEPGKRLLMIDVLRPKPREEHVYIEQPNAHA